MLGCACWKFSDGIQATARAVGTGNETVHRIAREMREAGIRQLGDLLRPGRTRRSRAFGEAALAVGWF